MAMPMSRLLLAYFCSLVKVSKLYKGTLLLTMHARGRNLYPCPLS